MYFNRLLVSPTNFPMFSSVQFLHLLKNTIHRVKKRTQFTFWQIWQLSEG